MTTDTHQPDDIDVSIVVPIFNEEENVPHLFQALSDALATLNRRYEIILIDDGSTDGTSRAVRDARADGKPEIRLIRHSVRSGQSAAVATGVREARAPWIATLDGDGQNDPAFLPEMVEALQKAGLQAGMVQGQRVGRQDTRAKKWASRFANGLRGWLLRDGVRDSGCGLKAFRRDAYLELPFFDHIHRFMPAMMLRANVLESAMPTMISAAALAMAHGLAPRLAAALVGYGIVLCLATLPAWAWLLARIA